MFSSSCWEYDNTTVSYIHPTVQCISGLNSSYYSTVYTSLSLSLSPPPLFFFNLNYCHTNWYYKLSLEEMQKRRSVLRKYLGGKEVIASYGWVQRIRSTKTLSTLLFVPYMGSESSGYREARCWSLGRLEKMQVLILTWTFSGNEVPILGGNKQF